MVMGNMISPELAELYRAGTMALGGAFAVALVGSWRMVTDLVGKPQPRPSLRDTFPSGATTTISGGLQIGSVSNNVFNTKVNFPANKQTADAATEIEEKVYTRLNMKMPEPNPPPTTESESRMSPTLQEQDEVDSDTESMFFSRV